MRTTTKQDEQKKRFVRYKEGAELYSMGLTKFKELSRNAGAIYKINNMALVNTEIFEQYLELYRI